MKILVVDDNQDLGVILGIRLRRLGHIPLLALRADDALYMLAPDVDALVTDIDMPEMNGVELARQVRELLPELPIAFCTGSDPRSELAREAAAIGPVLPKATKPEQARTLIAALTGEPAALRETPRLPAYVPVAYRVGENERLCYTQNLSRGGMFLRDAPGLRNGDRLELRLLLPERDPHPIAVEVCYTLQRGEAAECGREPGAGVRVLESADTAPLHDHLRRLERRGDHVIMTNDACCASLFGDAGYRVRDAPTPDDLAELLARGQHQIRAVFVGQPELEAYARAAEAAGCPGLVRPSAPPIVLHEAMAELDREL